IITEEDCGTTRGLLTRAVVDGGEIIATLAERIIGRCGAVDVLDPLSGEVVLKAAELIDEDAVDAIERAGVDAVSIRSVLTCEAPAGVCGKCYGRDLARGTMVNMGEAVGVIAAQSIGEPGTQLTMRTFHIGGAAQRGAEQSSIEAAFDAKVEVKNRNVVINSAGLPVVMGRNTEIVLLDEAGREKARHRVPYGARRRSAPARRLPRRSGRGPDPGERAGSTLLPAGRRDPLGRERRAGQGGRRARQDPARILEDARHHRRSAAGGRAVRGEEAEGF